MVDEAGTKYPFTSTMTWVLLEALIEMAPAVPALTIAAWALMRPAETSTDVLGSGCPVAELADM